MIDLEDTIRKCLIMTRGYDESPDWAHGLKLGEECGEVQQAILKSNGFLDHKELDESLIYEVADVINVCMALLTSHYPNMLVDDILVRLDIVMNEKNKKYHDILIKRKANEK